MNLKKNILIAGLLCTFGVVGASSLALSTNFDSKVAKADTPAIAETHYVYTYSDSITNWEDDGCETRVWNATNSAWLTLAPVGSNGHTYSFTWPTTCSTIIVCRHNGADWLGQTWDIPYNSANNYYEITSWSDGKASYNVGHVKEFSAGDKIYVDIQEASSFWYESGNTAYIYGALGSSTFWLNPTRVGSSNLHVFEFAAAAKATFIQVVRNTSATWTGAPNHTPNIGFTKSNENNLAIKLGSDSYSTTAVKGMEAFSDAYIADAYGYYFLQQSICEDAGGLASGYATAWANAKSVYTSLSALLSSATYIKTASNSGSDNINVAMLRYDTALAKNPSLENFIDRAPLVLAGASLSEVNMTNTGTLILVLVSVFALAAAGSFFFIRKRRLEK